MKSISSKASCIIKASLIALSFCTTINASDDGSNHPFHVRYSGPLSVLSMAAAPFVTAYTSPQTSLIYNACNLLSPAANLCASYAMDWSKGNSYVPDGPRVVFGLSLLRNIPEFGMALAAAGFSYAYFSTGNDSYRTITLTLNTVNAIATIVGTAGMYFLNYKGWSAKH